jgi:hypothetical protein
VSLKSVSVYAQTMMVSPEIISTLTAYWLEVRELETCPALPDLLSWIYERKLGVTFGEQWMLKSEFESALLLMLAIDSPSPPEPL